MSGISGLVSSALTGLEASQQALQVTGNNIANVGTAGYSREQANQTTALSTLVGGLYLGNGTQIASVTRNYNAYMQSQVWSTTATASGASTYNSQLQPIVQLLAGTGTGMSTAINQFFASGVAGVAANPSDAASRQAMLGQAEQLAQTVQSTATQLQQVGNGINQQLAQGVDLVNNLTSQIAKLNNQIAIQSSTGAAPNTLLDQQGALIEQLAGQVGVTVLQQGNQFNVYAGNGQALVVGNQSFQLTTKANPYDSSQTEVAYAATGQIISQNLSGGAIGGLLNLRNQVLIPAQNQLGLIADGLATAMNQQQSLGLTTAGTSGSAMFSYGQPQVLASSLNSDYGASGTTYPSASVVAASGLTGSDYKAQWDGSQWTVTNLNTGSVVVSGVASGSVSFDGLSVNLPASGVAKSDSFEIMPTRIGALDFKALLSDPSSVAAASPYVSSQGQLSSGALVNTNLGNMTLSAGAYSSGSAGIGLVLSGSIGSPPATLQVQLTSGGAAGSVGFVVTSGAGSVIGSGSVSLGGSGSVIGIAYPGTPAGSKGYWTVDLSGSVASSGDAFTLQPGGAGNGGNAQAMAALQSAKTLSSGTASLQDAYAQLASKVATQGGQAQTALSAATALAAQANASQQSYSGVNLDQEATNLIQYQQAYQAAAKAIQIGSSLFSTLLQAIG
jgi:flagellar hook-associated protein 1 FlgK